MNVQEYNDQIICEYLDYKKDVPENTYKGISADCKVIAKYLSDNDLVITSLTEAAPSEQFVSYLTEKYTPATVKRKLCTLRSIIYWCQEKGYIPIENEVNIYDDLETHQYQFASDDDIAKLYNFCKNIWESDEYVMARAKLECLMVIICGFKVSELINLRIQDVSGSIIDDKMKMVCCTSSKCIDTFLRIRADFTDLKLIKSNILFVNKYGKKNQQINLDYEIIRKQCGVSASVTLSSIRNSCVKECSILLDNDAVAAKLFDVAVRRLGMIKNYKVNSITDDEALMLEQYRKLSPIQKKEIMKLMMEK